MDWSMTALNCSTPTPFFIDRVFVPELIIVPVNVEPSQGLI